MRRPLNLLAVMVAALLIGACGGGGSSATKSTTAPSSGSSSAKGSQASSKDTGSSCPLTADDVSSVMGATMKADPDFPCSFIPADASEDLPTADYQRSTELTAAQRKQAGFVNTIDGVGDEAYATNPLTDGLQMLVRSKSHWFQVTVNTNDIHPSDPQSGRDVAKALAERVIANLG